LQRSLSTRKYSWFARFLPLNQVVLGGQSIYHKDDYIMFLKKPKQVEKIAKAVQLISKDSLRKGYFNIDGKSYGFDLTNEDFEYTWDWFENTLKFWQKAASKKRFVLFTADQ
jgi:Domain of unknown function (DUF1877)